MTEEKNKMRNDRRDRQTEMERDRNREREREFVYVLVSERKSEWEID